MTLQSKPNAITLKVKYMEPGLKPLEYIDDKSDWIDLRCAETVTMKRGDFRLLSLGVAIEMPEGYEAHIVPRSSTFRHMGIILVNSVGIIDNTYCGDEDVWMFPAFAIRDTELHFNDRIAQFRLFKNQEHLEFETVESLGNSNRGGFGSTGVN